MPKANNVLTTGDVAKICNIAAGMVYKWFDNGLLKGYASPAAGTAVFP